MLKQLFLMLAAGIALTAATIASADSTPTDAIRGSVESILTLLQDKELDQTTRRGKIRKVINARFDFRAMSQRTLATNWKKASDEQQKEFVQLFSKLIENTYIGRVEAYTDEKVDYPGAKIKGKKAVVETLILTASADIPVNYKVYLKKDKWWVYDVIIEGISLISNYRSSYQEIVKKDGFDGLIVKMKAKIKELETQPA
ncbi:MAG: ABC transporter substrate-binding protein [Gammaproteobacteria bacterium]|jgi:phospholipid transport system substrate-binding protein|nr:ABC transporter substrate-binding protein [Gammaproteobacteria bacterium]